MAEIIRHNAQDNPRLNEIYEILLLAGYFRIRIGSLGAFDKVVGGVAWCITSSNFEVELEYSDEMQLGQKIRVAEHICQALKNMQCPYLLQPFQLQGLDVNNIFPVVQWLVKFVYQTRFERQKYNREISLLLGGEILKAGPRGSTKSMLIQLKRNRVNRQIQQTKNGHPIRVYSALLEFGDATALKMYHKLHNIITNKRRQAKAGRKGDKKQKGDKSDKGDDFMSYLQEEEEGQQEQSLQNFGQIAGGKLSLQRLQKVISQNRDKLQAAIKQGQALYQENVQIQQQTSENSEEKEIVRARQQKDRELVIIKQQNQKYHQQLGVLRTQVSTLEELEKKVEQEKQALLSRQRLVQQQRTEVQEKYAEIQEIGKEIQEALAQKKGNLKLEKLVQRRGQLKERKAEVKKRAKAMLQQLQGQRAVAEASAPEIDTEAFESMLQEAQTKKTIFDKKYQQLTRVNQQLAILQRKAQKFTSAAQVYQYHQKFIELFEAINCLIEQKRNLFAQTTNLESCTQLARNYQEFLNNAKDGVINAKKKQQKKDLGDNLKEILEGFQSNLRNAKTTLEKLKSKRQQSYAKYMDLILNQREYLKILRTFKVEYENVQKLYK